MNIPVIATISGGRDSTAMLLRYLELGYKVDYILFSDTLSEFPMMYEYLDEVNKFIAKKYGKSIVYLKPFTEFEDWCFGTVTKGKSKGYIRGLPKTIDPCYWTRESKVRPVERFLKAVGLTPYVSEYIKLIGYTKSEEKRADKKNNHNERYPLIEWGWCEGDVDVYLKSIDMVNPLYKWFSRTGCSFCPHMSLRSYYIIWKHFKKTWRYMKRVERKLRKYDNVVNRTWNIRFTMVELEKQFINGGRVYDDTPAKDCLCVI